MEIDTHTKVYEELITDILNPDSAFLNALRIDVVADCDFSVLGSIRVGIGIVDDSWYQEVVASYVDRAVSIAIGSC